jgi:hypothetical protein
MNAAWLVAPVVLLSISSPALAASTAQLTYEAPAACPTEGEFLAAVTDRGGDFDARATQGRRQMVVSIRKQGAGFAGEFQVREERDTTDKREVRGASCVEVADALAVVTAIALHANAANGSPSPAAATPPAPTPSSVPESRDGVPATSAPPPLTPPDERLLGSTRAFPPRTEAVQVGAGTLRFDLKRSVTVYAGAAFGVIPSLVLPRYDLSQVVAHFVTTPEGAQRISGLVLKLRLGVMGPGTYRSPDTKTDASGLTFGMDLCQSPHYDTKGLVMLFCGGFGGGLMLLKTRALDGAQIQSKNSGLGEASLSGELQYYLGAGFHLGLKVGGALSIGDVTAERTDGSRIFKSSPWSAYALLGMGFRF